MNATAGTILVPVLESTVARLMALRRNSDESLAEVLARLSMPPKPIPSVAYRSARRPNSEISSPGRYSLQILGESFIVATLAEALAKTLSVLAELDAGLLERVEKMGGRARRHIARNREDIHLGRPDLNARFTLQFRPGWWVGTNYSRSDTKRILRDICQAAGLEYLHDVKLIES